MKRLLLVAVLAVTACGYTLQNSKSPLRDEQHIERVYVVPPTNNTYKAGVETMMYNALVRELAALGRVRVVQDPEHADGMLHATIQDANYGASPSGSTPAKDLKGGTVHYPDSTPYVATEYIASITCEFTLRRRTPLRPEQLRPSPSPSVSPSPKALARHAAPASPVPMVSPIPMASPSFKPALKADLIWSGTFSRSKLFPASNQVGALGTTSPLINDSEFDRALTELSQAIARDVNESMLATF